MVRSPSPNDEAQAAQRHVPFKSEATETTQELYENHKNSSDSDSGLVAARGQQQLGASASVGVSAARVSKKRSRASRRPPTTVLEADSGNFRSMVEQLTGIPAPPPCSFDPSRFEFLLQSEHRRQFRPFFTPFDYSAAGSLIQFQNQLSLRRSWDHQEMNAPRQHQSFEGSGRFLGVGSPSGCLDHELVSSHNSGAIAKDFISGFNTYAGTTSGVMNSTIASQGGDVYFPQAGVNQWECDGPSLNASCDG